MTGSTHGIVRDYENFDAREKYRLCCRVQVQPQLWSITNWLRSARMDSNSLVIIKLQRSSEMSEKSGNRRFRTVIIVTVNLRRRVDESAM